MAFERVYRRLHMGVDLTYFNVKIKETDLNIGALCELSREALTVVARIRADLEGYAAVHPEFITALYPIQPLADAPDIVKKMCGAAEKAGVGPMAAVAGAVAQEVGEALREHSSEIIVENGGDIYMASRKERHVAILAGSSVLSGRAAMKIRPEKTPLGICTSSGTLGHSLSFGQADAAIVLAPDAALADACATLLGNLIRTPGDLSPALEKVCRIEGVMGAVAIIGEKIAALGDIELSAAG
ncbi:MAG: UPF0280 family protein [Bacillota bacterium]|nr:UPF0280 family protein [Bacillota bacterium]